VVRTKQIHLLERPAGLPEPGQFALREVNLPELGDGQVLVQNLYMSVDPYMRRSMDAVQKDLPPWPIGGALDGPSVGRVVESRNPNFAPGDVVESMSGWQQHFISDGDEFVPYISANTAIAKRDVSGRSAPEDFLGLLGIASQTAYFGLKCGAEMVPGETVVISSGAGTVGSIACQIAKLHGMRVVSSAGSDEKVALLRNDLNVDFAFNYKTTSFSDGLAQGCPDGIDLVFENASPEHFSACLPLMNEMKTMLIAGFISIYSSGGTVSNLANFEYALDRFLTIRAFAFMEFLKAFDHFVADMLTWREQGKIQLPQQIHDGLEQSPEAFCSLFTGESRGKQLVRIAL
jgi:NADPH-dependent curcumin reductase CurA